MLNKSISEPRLALALLIPLTLSACGRLRYDPRDASPEAGFVDDLGRIDLIDASDARFSAGDSPLPNCPTAIGPLGAGACPAVCSGGCEEGICTIDCGGEGACITEVRCPAGWPCRIACGGSRACTAATFDGSNASSLSVVCAGGESCVAADMICPTSGDCGVLCGGAMSCVSFSLACGPGRCAADCTDANATSFEQTCNGSGCCSLVNCG